MQLYMRKLFSFTKDFVFNFNLVFMLLNKLMTFKFSLVPFLKIYEFPANSFNATLNYRDILVQTCHTKIVEKSVDNLLPRKTSMTTFLKNCTR